MTAALHTVDADRIDVSAKWSDEHRKRRDFAFALAWRALSEWASIAWDVSERPSLLSAWRAESSSVVVDIVNAYSRLRALATSLPPRGAGRNMEPDGLMYFPDARRDLEVIVAIPLRALAYDESNEIVDPADLAQLIESELVAISRETDRERARLDAQFGSLLPQPLHPA
jgi:hypothetical protein